MKPLSQQMSSLISIAEDVLIGRRAAWTRLEEHELTLFAELRRIDRLPAEGVRRTCAAMVMISAIEGLQNVGSEEGRTRWLMLIGAALPLLKNDAWHRLCDERETSRG